MSVHAGEVTLALCGDVMLGRGIDQILPHPGDPALREPAIVDARAYVSLAEARNGPIPRPVDVSWPWGEALRALDEAGPDVRVVNLETSVTRSDEFAPGKAVHYRMSPENLTSLAVARPDVCTLANNHVLDFGLGGLAETLGNLWGAGLSTAGAGRDLDEARQPAVVTLDRRRVLVFSVGAACSGVPTHWTATAGRSGVEVVAEASPAAARDVVDRIRRHKRHGDLVVASVHMGSNWGYRVPRAQVGFAHALVDGGADIVHGHSSHHPRPVEVYRGRIILYGCGDFINDYEGIAGHEEYRSDLRLLHLVSVHAATGELASARMVPLRARRMRLEHAPDADAEWLRTTLDRVTRRFGPRIGLAGDGVIAVHPP